MTTGIHHITAITRNVQRNVDFYAGFLGLRLVKKTGGYEDGAQLHLVYGDWLGSPGSLITFLVWQDGAAGRVGLGQVSEIALAIPPVHLGGWLQKAMAAGIPFTGPARELGETVLRLRDPDGITVKLVGMEMPAAAPLPDPMAPLRIRSATILTGDAQATAAFLRRFGYAETLRDGPFLRMASESDVIDLRQSAGFVTGAQGTGVFDHVAFRAPDIQAVQQMRLELRDHEGATNVHDRQYFLSLYVREPMGTLFEYATDGPGFTVDEAAGDLGRVLMVPPHDAARADDLRVILPQFALPGEDRMPMRDLPFIHRLYVPDDPDGSVIVLLHGTGGDETDLMPLAARVNRRATLLGVRGRSTEEGMNRWFRRLDATTFDQDDIRAEAAAFAAFTDGAMRGYGLDPARMVFLGYSNGANLLGAVLRLHPGTIRRAIMLRGIEVLESPPVPDLRDVSVLLLSGQRDAHARLATPLAQALRDAGASLDQRMIAAGHELSPEDQDMAKGWLGG
ncbi:VOC family protein [Paracoccus sp. (in: a-proteobacteria)]|uniref:VOC family protein n=1 Tax=Paracoccus sp. TaxID=267 RepID=UPI003A84CCEA